MLDLLRIAAAQAIAGTVGGEAESEASSLNRLTSAALVGTFVHAMDLVEPQWDSLLCRPDAFIRDDIPWVHADAYEAAVPLTAVAIRTL